MWCYLNKLLRTLWGRTGGIITGYQSQLYGGHGEMPSISPSVRHLLPQLLSVSSGTALALESHFTKSHPLSLGSPLPLSHQWECIKTVPYWVNLRQLWRASLLLDHHNTWLLLLMLLFLASHFHRFRFLVSLNILHIKFHLNVCFPRNSTCNDSNCMSNSLWNVWVYPLPQYVYKPFGISLRN